MHRLVVVLFTALLVGCGPVRSQSDAAGREARILANLRFEFPQLEDTPVSVDSLRPSGVDGLDEGVLTIGGQLQPFLVTRDGSRLYLLAARPIDASRSDEALAAAQAERERVAAAEARDRAQALAAATAGLPTRGPSSAPVTIVEFSDFQCPYCRLASATVETLLARYPADVKLVYAHFPLGNHDWAQPAAAAASCAAAQSPDAFWTLHDAYFAGQQAFTAANLADRSRAALAGTGIDLDAWAACTDSPAAVERVRQQTALGETHGVGGTPGFFVNGRFINGNQPLETFVAAVEDAKGDS